MKTIAILSFAFASLLAIFAASPLLAQATLPGSAEVDSYFPQFVDGGPVSGQWQTIFTFANPNTSTVSLTLYLVGSGGQPLQMDFGSGPGSQFSVTVPPRGTMTFASRIISAVTNIGWAEAVSSLPIQGVVSYRFLQNGIPSQEISVPSTLPTEDFFSPANAYLGLAVANVYSASTITLQITARGNDGSVIQAKITIPPLAHQSFYLSQVVPGLNTNFLGTVEIGGPNSPYPYFVALTLKSDAAGMFSSLPSGNVSLPISQYDRIKKVFANVQKAASTFIPSPDSIQLNIASDSIVNAFGNSTGITIELATAELIADSDSELAFLIGHELGHVYQFRSGTSTTPKLVWNSDLEFDADIWGVYFSLLAAYDPYAGAGALSKIYMATGQAGLTATFFEAFLSPDMHKSLNQRLDGVETMIQQLCSSSQNVAASCSQVRQVLHPHFPTSIPLVQKGPEGVK